MKIAAIIAEFNPFHNGHQYHIEQTRLLTGADYILVVMSGDFVQRGAPALCNKYIRTQMALLEGADAVLELPALYAVSSAEYFAGGGVTLLNQLGVVDCLSFGSEQGSIEPFISGASQLLSETPDYSTELLSKLKQGKAYPAARQEALSMQNVSVQATPASESVEDELSKLLSAPNNILGLEYCKALLAAKSTIRPITVKRADSAYHDLDLSTSDSPLSSASAIRQELNCGNIQIENHLPKSTYKLLEQSGSLTRPVTTNDFSSLLFYKLLSEQEKGYYDYLDCTPDLSNKIRNSLNDFACFDDFCLKLKSKDLTYTRISRVLMHILLNITKPDFFTAPLLDRNLFTPYARLLGFRENATKLLSAIKRNSSIPLISKPADAPKLLTQEALSMLQQDIFCANIYESIRAQSTTPCPSNDITRSPIIVLTN